MRSSPLAAGLGLALCVGASAAPQTPTEPTAAAVDRYLQALQPRGFHGGVVLLKEGRTLLCKAYGLSDREEGTPLQTFDRLTTGSLTKQFTATAIAQLEDEGLLSLDDALIEFFPDAPDHVAGITVAQLLSHTSGLVGGLASDTDPRATREWILEQTFRRPLDSRPGTRHEYSNLGYSLLAMIIEEVTGLGYEEYLQDEIFGPAGMEHTGMVLADWSRGREVRGYRNGQLAPTFLDEPMLEDGPFWTLRGNGGILSTLEDMERWMRVLDGESELLSAELRERLERPIFGDESQGYGYGWGHLRSPRGTHVVEHDGGNGIFNADVHRYVEEGFSICVMTSVAEWKAEDVIESVAALAFGEPRALPPAPAQSELPPAGRYRLPGGEELELFDEGTHFRLGANGPRGLALLAGREPEKGSERVTALAKALRAARTGDWDPLHACLQERIPVAQLRDMLPLAPDRPALLLPATRPTAEQWVEVPEGRGRVYALLRPAAEGYDLAGMDSLHPRGHAALNFWPAAGGGFESWSLDAERRVAVEWRDGSLRFADRGEVGVARRIDGD